MEFKIKAYSIWEFGQRKDSAGNPHQEDSLYPAFGSQTDQDRLFILCDGMGGHSAGEVASSTVCQTMSDVILHNAQEKGGGFTRTEFDEALDAAFDALDEKDNSDPKKMGTTMTLLKLYEEGAFIAHIGDSRVYHIRPGADGEKTKILFQTYDHSLINDLIKVGELTKEEAKHSSQKNVITRAMQPGMDPRPKADIHTTKNIKKGDYFMLCSDGMLEELEMESGNALRNIFSEKGGDAENKVKILRQVTAENKDNHTAIIVHIIDVIGASTTSTLGETAPNNKGSIQKSVNKSWIYVLLALIIAGVILIGFYLFSSTEQSGSKPLPTPDPIDIMDEGDGGDMPEIEPIKRENPPRDTKVKPEQPHVSQPQINQSKPQEIRPPREETQVPVQNPSNAPQVQSETQPQPSQTTPQSAPVQIVRTNEEGTVSSDAQRIQDKILKKP